MVLELRDVCKSFGEKRVLNGIGFTAAGGGALGLLGRNGAGKTTTIRIVMDIFKQDSGEVSLKKDGAALPRSRVKMGYMPEERGLYPKKKIIEQMVYFGELRGLAARAAKKSAERLLGELEADEYLDKKLETLSKGNQQKIQLAIALINDPDVVILDEPFSGLDPVNSVLLKRMIDSYVKRDKIVLFSSHQMPYVEEFCSHVCIINKGVIVLDGELPEIKKGYPRNRIRVVPGPETGLESLKKILQEASGGFIKNIEESRGGVVVTLRDESGKRPLLDYLNARGVCPDLFAVTEPTLEEIFVEKAGNDEPV